MKRLIIIMLMLLGNATLFCQIRTGDVIEYRMEAQELPYKIAFGSSFDRDGEIWRPLKRHVSGTMNGIPKIVEEDHYRYNTKGVLQEEKTYSYGDPSILGLHIYNQTFTKEGFDFPDTSIAYVKGYRTYYDYHYYNSYLQDSFYYVSYTEQWNDLTQEWEMKSKRYQGHFDTTLFVIREMYNADYVDGEWVIWNGIRILREYDEDGLVTAHTGQRCDPQTNYEYKFSSRNEFIYDENNMHIETYSYRPDGDDWKLSSKLTDIEYAEWYPNGHPGIQISILNGPEYLGLADKRVKRKSATEWLLNDNGEWEKSRIEKSDWDINGTKSHTDTLYQFYDDAWFLRQVHWNMYDEREDFILKFLEKFLPDGTLSYSSKDCFLWTYHPEYDEIESCYYYDIMYNTATQLFDSTFRSLVEYLDWWDITQPVSIAEPEAANVAAAALSIFPNPVSGVVTISTTSEMQQLNVYDITGRLVKSQTPASNQVVFDTGALPKGIYLVQALLKDGGQRTGKVVVR